MLPEKVYKAAGYTDYPNDIDFCYTFDWVKVSTYKFPGSTYGVLRVSWNENTTSQQRKLVVYIKGTYESVIDLVQEASLDGDRQTCG